MMRDAGATEVHFRVASPPTEHSLLLRRRHARALASCSPRGWTSQAMREFIQADSLAFVSIDGLYRAVGEAGPQQRLPAILRRLLHRRLPDPR